MKLQYIGSGSAEGVPAPFCRCETCRRVREVGGPNIRRRSGLCVNDTVLIDFPPDVVAGTRAVGVDLTGVTDIFITHSHHDHFAPTELFLRDPVEYCTLDAPNLRLHGNDGVKRALDTVVSIKVKETPYLDFCPLTYFEPVEAPNGVRFTYLPARHKPDEHSGFYLIEDGRVRALYAHDTGIFPDETVAFLAGKPLDFASFDCNYGLREVGVMGHMGLPEVRQVVARLREVGAVTEQTRLVVSHITHFCGSLHDELEAACLPEGFTVAYDGMTVEV